MTNAVSSVKLTPTASDASATITVNGSVVASGSASSSLPLNVGANTITIVVTPEYGSTKTYTVTVTRAPTAATSITPTSGSTNGGTSVAITGTDLSGVTSLKFGTSLAVFTINSATSITATTPTHVAGAVDVSVFDGTNTSTLQNAFTYNAATLALSPSAGSLPAATVGTSYSQTISASGGTASYSYAVTSGSLPAEVNLNTSTGAITGTPSAVGNSSFTITATDANSVTQTASYSLNVAAGAPTIASITPTSGSTNGGTSVAITGTYLSGVTSLKFGTSPAVFTINSATSITATTPVHVVGAVDVSVSDGTNTSTLPNAFTYNAATLALSPSAGSLPAATVGTSYSQTISASGGTASYSYAVTSGSLPAEVNLNTSTGVITGTPSTAGGSSFTITATDANSVTSSAAYTLAIAVQAPVANAVSATIAANSSSNAITLILTGGAATSVTVASPAGHGTATASGTSITYTPTAGYSGSDSFTYTATNASGTSNAATVSIMVAAPTLTLSPSAGVLTSGTVGTSYSQIISASGGTVPYSYAVTSGSLPAGLSLNASTGAITGMPSTAGGSSFTITATDANNALNSVAYSVLVNPAPSTSLTLSPSGGALPEAMAGEEYRQQVSATNGTGVLIYNISSGSLPPGMVLNVSSGELTGPLDAGTEGNYSFTVKVDSNSATGSASFNLRVKPREVTVTDKVVALPAGTAPNNVNLAAGATGGPFVSAAWTFVEPPNAGTVSIVNGEFAQSGGSNPTGWYLKFIPNPAYVGQVSVGFRLTSALGVSNAGTVTYSIGAIGDVAVAMDTLVHGFVQTRQNLIASTIKVPGLLERRQMAKATDPVTARMMPSGRGVTLGFSTSLAQMEAARNNADGAIDAELSVFNIWLDGVFMAHNREDNGNKWGNFAMVSFGADYLLSEKALVGISVHYDRMTDPTGEDATLTGNGWLAGPYASMEIGRGVFWDSSLLYGGSSNTIDHEFWDGGFDTTRWMFDTAMSGQWKIDDRTTLTPKLRTVYFSERVKDYAVTNDTGDLLEIRGLTENQLRVSLGAEIARQFTLENDMTLTPKLGVTGGFAGLDGSGGFGQISAGLSLDTESSWIINADLLFNIAADNEKAVGAKVGISGKF